MKTPPSAVLTDELPDGDEYYKQWFKSGTGLYSTNGAVIGFTVKSSVAENDEPDLFILACPVPSLATTQAGLDAVAQPHDKWTLLLKGHARFRGRVTLQSDPLDPPHIDFNYFERDKNGNLTANAEKDLQAMREGVRVIINC